MTIGQSKPLEKCEKEGRGEGGEEGREGEWKAEMTMVGHFATSIFQGNSVNSDTGRSHRMKCIQH